MLLFNKLFIIITILILNFWATVVPVDSAGIVFDWQPFTAEIKEEKARFSPDIILKKSPISKEIRDQFNDVYYLLPDDSVVDNGSSKRSAQKSALDRIKVSFTQVNSFMLSPDETSLPGKETKLSDITRTASSFFKNPSQETAVQTLKLIQPQVNLGFDF